MAGRSASPFGPLPVHGIWTAVGLRRGQFLAVLGLSIVLFVLVDGPVWRHLRESHFARIAVSYGAIPPAAMVALARNGRLTPRLLVAASGVIALVKLIVTAGLLVAIALANPSGPL